MSERISWAKAHLLSPSEADADMADAYAAYERALAAAHAVDFDDLVLRAVRLLEMSERALSFAHERCRWLFVDEYQDINAAQYRFVRLLAPGSANLCAVGDPDQAIYGFRGSDPSYFARFERDYPDAVAVALVQSYRSAAPIVTAAAAVIEASPGRAARRLEPRVAAGDAVEHFVVEGPREEAELIAQTIDRAVGGTTLEAMRDAPERALAFHDVAVLARTSAQLQPIAAALTAANLPFHLAGDDPLAARAKVSELVAWLGALARGSRHGFTADVAKLVPDIGKKPVSELCARLGAAGADEAWKAAAEFCALLAVPFGNDVAAFVEAVPLMRESDVGQGAQKIALLTLHASKGLEFALVFVAGCEDGLLPLGLFGRSSDREEERRLLYVGMTRAKHRLVLTSARNRSLLGRAVTNGACPFLHGLPAEVVVKTEVRSARPARQQLALF